MLLFYPKPSVTPLLRHWIYCRLLLSQWLLLTNIGWFLYYRWISYPGFMDWYLIQNCQVTLDISHWLSMGLPEISRINLTGMLMYSNICFLPNCAACQGVELLRRRSRRFLLVLCLFAFHFLADLEWNRHIQEGRREIWTIENHSCCKQDYWEQKRERTLGSISLWSRMAWLEIHKNTHFSVWEFLGSRFIDGLTHWGRDKMAAVSQTLSNAFSWMKISEFRLRFHWSLFLRVQLTIIQHWFR